MSRELRRRRTVSRSACLLATLDSYIRMSCEPIGGLGWYPVIIPLYGTMAEK